MDTQNNMLYKTYLSSGSGPDNETWGKLDSSASGATEQPEKQTNKQTLYKCLTVNTH